MTGWAAGPPVLLAGNSGIPGVPVPGVPGALARPSKRTKRFLCSQLTFRAAHAAVSDEFI